MTRPLVTALVPVKQFHREYLRRAVASMLEQTSPDWRLLAIVEEPAEEGLAEALAPALEDERVRVVVNEGRKLAGAINTGMRNATTEYVAILLGDDMWAREAVELLNACIERSPQVDFFHSGRMIVDGDDRPISSHHPARVRFTLEDFAGGSPVKHLLCWRRSAGLAIGGLDESLNSVGPDDYDFPWSMAEAGMRFEAFRPASTCTAITGTRFG
jgi:glycosyltransferase involved in cell wall biosynthesis